MNYTERTPDVLVALFSALSAWFAANMGDIIYLGFAALLQVPCIAAGSRFRVGVMASRVETDQEMIEREKILSREILFALALVSFGLVLMIRPNFGVILISAVIMGALGPVALQPGFEWFNRLWGKMP